MEAKKCDRCGAFYVPNYKTNGVQATIGGFVPRDVKFYDLCDECGKELQKFFGMEEQKATKDN